MNNRRVVITGVGAVSPYGLGVERLIAGAKAGMSCVRHMDAWQEIKGLASYLAAPVPKFDAKKFLPRVARRSMGDMAVYATLASQEAVRCAKIPPDMLQSDHFGVVMSSTTGSPSAYENLYEQFLPDKSIESFTSGLFFQIMSHSCSANVMHSLGIRGEQWAPCSACTSSAQAIGLGYLLIRSGRQTAVLCGGADEVHHSVTMFFDVLRAASHDNKNPQRCPKPFDVMRDGVVCGGGSGVLLLESLDSAKQRGAKIFAEITGFGNVSDPSHIATPHADAMSLAMNKALSEAGIMHQDVDYVNAHATGTQQGDEAEAVAISRTLGSQVPVSSMKGHIGHTLGAAGALESILTLAMMEQQELLPTLNIDTVDPNCSQCNILTKKLQTPVKTALKNSFALGGVNVAIVYQAYDE
jgi:3-oxoacyl-[acyl-carrier-protein] synthase II